MIGPCEVLTSLSAAEHFLNTSCPSPPKSSFICIYFFVFIECDGGLFGMNCSIPCKHCLNNQQCHHINGACANGCDPGYIGNTCTEGTEL